MKNFFVAVIFFTISTGILFAQEFDLSTCNDLLYTNCAAVEKISDGIYNGYSITKCSTNLLDSSNYRACDLNNSYAYAKKICLYYQDGVGVLKVIQNIDGSMEERRKVSRGDGHNCEEHKYNNAGEETVNDGYCNANMQKEGVWKGDYGFGTIVREA